MSNKVEVKGLGVLFGEVAKQESAAKLHDRAVGLAKQQAVYERAAFAYGVVIEALKPERTAEYSRELLLHQVKRAKEGDNVMLPAVRCIYGKFLPNKPRVRYMTSAELVEWQVDKSGEKYASVFAYLSMMGVTPDKAAEFMSNFDHDVHGKGIRGIVATWSELQGERRSGKEKPVTFKAPAGCEDGAYVVVVDVKGNSATFRGIAHLDASEKGKIVGLVPKAKVEPSAKDVATVEAEITKLWKTADKERVAPKTVEEMA